MTPATRQAQREQRTHRSCVVLFPVYDMPRINSPQRQKADRCLSRAGGRGVMKVLQSQTEVMAAQHGEPAESHPAHTSKCLHALPCEFHFHARKPQECGGLSLERSLPHTRSPRVGGGLLNIHFQAKNCWRKKPGSRETGAEPRLDRGSEKEPRRRQEERKGGFPEMTR